jgi:hypothetical protein
MIHQRQLTGSFCCFPRLDEKEQRSGHLPGVRGRSSSGISDHSLAQPPDIGDLPNIKGSPHESVTDSELGCVFLAGI